MPASPLPKRLARYALPLAVLCLLLVFALPAYRGCTVCQLPRIHDISTDTQDPPAFVALLEQRKNAPNGVAYTPEVAALQQQGYPDIAPLLLPVPAPQAFARAEGVARAMGWTGIAADAAALRIEATAHTPLFGFKDDVVIRIRPQGQGSRVDVRSVSRVGSSDLGANAARIRAFLLALQAAG